MNVFEGIITAFTLPQVHPLVGHDDRAHPHDPQNHQATSEMVRYLAQWYLASALKGS